MKTNKILLTIITAIGLLASSCTDGFDELNKNPNGVDNDKYDFSLIDVGTAVKLFGNYNYTLANDALAGGGHLQERIKMLTIDPYVQYTTGAYGANDSWQSDYWNGHYTTYIGLLNGVIRDAAVYENRENPKAYALIWRAYVQTMFTDYFGPAPYSNDPLDPNPDYLSLDKLYPLLFKDLEDAPKIFSNDPLKRKLNADLDPFFGGDFGKWTKFANTLRLRMALKLSEIDPELCKAQATAAVKAEGGLISSPADDALSPSYELWGNTYPYQVIGWSTMRLTSSMEKMLTGIGDMDFVGEVTHHPAKVDPRATLMFDPSARYDVNQNPENPKYETFWAGMNPAMADAGTLGQRVGRMSIANFRSNPDKKIKHMTYIETCFLLAEAVQRGFVSSADANGTAKEWYEKGVRASFAEWGLNEKVDAYLASEAKNGWGTSAKYDDVAGAGNTALEKIVTQRYIYYYPDMAIQAWNDKRRLNLPAWDIPEVRNTGSGTWPTDKNIQNPANYIQRSLYPQNEAMINKDKYNAGVAQLRDGDKLSSPLWWASKGNNYCTSVQ